MINLSLSTRLFCKHLAITLIMVPLLSSSSLAQETIDPNVTQYTLPNGLNVALAPSKTAQNVALVTRYNVGSANEAPGRSGFAHLFEHLMFEGTNAVPDFDKLVSGVGGQNNAFTQRDSTTYYMTGPKEALPLFLRLDADRMANLANAVSQEDLDNQRAIVLNEMRQNLLDQPGGAARAQIDVTLYPTSHPYGHATIGSIADLNAAKLEDVVAFHRLNYVPANANVAITGNFEIDKAKAWIDATFGMIPKSESPKSPEATQFQPDLKRLSFIDEVPTPIVIMQWQGPSGFSKQTVTNGMLAGAMSVGKEAIDIQLKVTKGVASGVNVYWNEGDLGGTFNVIASAAQGVSAQKLETAMRAALNTLRDAGFTEDTLKIVRTDMETGYESVPSDPLGFAISLVESAANGDARTWKGEIDIAKTITAAEVSAALRNFTDDKAQFSVIEPGPRNTNYPPAIANSTGTSQPENVAGRADISIPEIALENAAELKLPQTQTRTLASGATLITYASDDPAKVGISITINGGALDAPVGLADLAMSLNSRGAGDLSLADLDKQYRESGISIYGSAGRHYSQITASAPLKNFDILTSQLAQAILSPRFDDKEWSAALDEKITSLEAAFKSPDYQAVVKLRQVLFPEGAPERREPDMAAIKLLKIQDAKALFQARLRPDQTMFHVASNLPIDRIAAALDKAFAEWPANAEPVKFAGYTKPQAKEVRLESQVDGATQTTILLAMAAPDEGTRQSVAFGIAVQVLGGDSNSRLNKVLREEKGWSYGIGASATGERNRNNSLLQIGTTVQSDHTEDSIKEIRRIIAAFGATPVTLEEFDSARRTMKANFLNAFNNAPGMASFAGSLYTQGYTLKDLEQYLAELSAVTLDEVNAEAKSIAQSPIALSIAGDKALMK